MTGAAATASDVDWGVEGAECDPDHTGSWRGAPQPVVNPANRAIDARKDSLIKRQLSLIRVNRRLLSNCRSAAIGERSPFRPGFRFIPIRSCRRPQRRGGIVRSRQTDVTLLPDSDSPP